MEHDGQPISFILDVIEVPKVRPYRAHWHTSNLIHFDQSHSGINLAIAFVQILDEFDISDKVQSSMCYKLMKH